MKAIEPEEILIDGEKPSTHPWTRFLARALDYALFFCLMPSAWNDEWIVPLRYVAWIPVEALLLTYLGTTPGKYLLGVRISFGRTGKMNFMAALRRSVAVWFRGLGMGLSFFMPLCLLYAYNTLTVKRITSWDREDHVHVSVKNIAEWRIYLAVLLASIGHLYYFNWL